MRDVSIADLAAGKECAKAGNHIREFANVSWPVIGHELLEQRWAGLNGAVAIACMEGGKVSREHGHVFSALPKGRGGEGQHVEPVIEVFAKATSLDLLLKVFVGGSDHSNIDLDWLAPAHGLDDPFLNGAKQFDLHVQGEVADLIEKEGSAMGEFESTHAVGNSPGKGAPFVAKEFALNELSGDCPTIDGHQVFLRPGRAVVKGLGNQFFSGATLPYDQHGGV